MQRHNPIRISKLAENLNSKCCKSLKCKNWWKFEFQTMKNQKMIKMTLMLSKLFKRDHCTYRNVSQNIYKINRSKLWTCTWRCLTVRRNIKIFCETHSNALYFCNSKIAVNQHITWQWFLLIFAKKKLHVPLHHFRWYI